MYYSVHRCLSKVKWKRKTEPDSTTVPQAILSLDNEKRSINRRILDIDESIIAKNDCAQQGWGDIEDSGLRSHFGVDDVGNENNGNRG